MFYRCKLREGRTLCRERAIFDRVCIGWTFIQGTWENFETTLRVEESKDGETIAYVGEYEPSTLTIKENT